MPAKWEPPSRAEVAEQRLGVAMDGVMIYILQEGWKELKVGTAFELAVWPTKDERSGELVDLAHAPKDEGTPAYQRWFNSHETALYQGHAARIADELEQAALQQSERGEELRSEAGYFRDNQHRMNYPEMREEEWPIGRGMVESGGKQHEARFCGPAMRWSRVGAEKLLPVRSAILSKRFDELWAKVYNAPQA